MNPVNQIPWISLPTSKLAEFCRRWRITELALFGSALRGELRPSSDIDLLVSFAPEAEWTLLDHVSMQQELSEILERPVDLVTRRAVERSDNWIRKREILSTARTVYAA